MKELNYYEAIIEVLEQGAYEIGKPVDIDQLQEMCAGIKKEVLTEGADLESCKAMCNALLVRCYKLELEMLAMHRNYQYIRQIEIASTLIEILEELYEWFKQTRLA